MTIEGKKVYTPIERKFVIKYTRARSFNKQTAEHLGAGQSGLKAQTQTMVKII